MGFSKVINEKQWVVYVKTYRGERFCVNFPKDPTTFSSDLKKNSKEKTFSIETAIDGVNYSLLASPKDHEDYFSSIIDNLKSRSNIVILDQNLTQMEGKQILDITFKDLEKIKMPVFCKMQTILTKNNVYSLFTSYKEDDKESHNYFISSFQIES